MTYKEYLTRTLSRFNVTEDDVEIMLFNEGLDELETVNPERAKLAIYNQLSLVVPLQNISEGGYSLSWNLEGIRIWYASLCQELGKPNMMQPTVKYAGNRW